MLLPSTGVLSGSPDSLFGSHISSPSQQLMHAAATCMHAFKTAAAHGQQHPQLGTCITSCGRVYSTHIQEFHCPQ
jgi:hypothetical protein